VTASTKLLSSSHPLILSSSLPSPGTFYPARQCPIARSVFTLYATPYLLDASFNAFSRNDGLINRSANYNDITTTRIISPRTLARARHSPILRASFEIFMGWQKVANDALYRQITLQTFLLFLSSSPFLSFFLFLLLTRITFHNHLWNYDIYISISLYIFIRL
jgi:hypothetical protein